MSRSRRGEAACASSSRSAPASAIDGRSPGAPHRRPQHASATPIEHASPATLRIGGDRRALVFSDDGPGIDPGRIGALFARPEQADSAAAGAARARAFAASAWRSPGACATCKAGGSPCARRSKAGRGTAFTLSFDAGADADAALSADASRFFHTPRTIRDQRRPRLNAPRHGEIPGAAAALADGRHAPLSSRSISSSSRFGLALIAWTCQHSRLDMALTPLVRRFSEPTASPGAIRPRSTSSAIRPRAACPSWSAALAIAAGLAGFAMRGAAPVDADPAHRRRGDVARAARRRCAQKR